MGNSGPQCVQCCADTEDKTFDRTQARKADTTAEDYSVAPAAFSETFIGTSEDPLEAAGGGRKDAKDVVAAPFSQQPQPLAYQSAAALAHDKDLAAEADNAESRPSAALAFTLPEDATSPAPETLGNLSDEDAMFINIKKTAGSKLGMDLSHRGTHLAVRKIYKGYAASIANDECAANDRPVLMEGDIILSVNGIAGNDQEMLKVCRTAFDVDFKFRRSGTNRAVSK
mmetsp:Transcript_32063/g.75216  ORF Transcript_32063/g.75216 Transcript_32063/m.75216 type:complete len:227 (+) Transcript_32063:62-742(+)